MACASSILVWRSKLLAFLVLCRSCFGIQSSGSLKTISHRNPDPAAEWKLDPNVKAPCFLCEMHGSGASRLYVNPRSDGIGMQATYVLYAMALAAKNGMNFGGVVGAYDTNTFVFDVMAVAFGTQSQNLRSTESPANPLRYDFYWTLEEDARNGSLPRNGRAVYLQEEWIGYGCDQRGMSFENAGLDINDFLTPSFLHTLRQHSKLPHTSSSSSEKKRVVMHVRRGLPAGKRQEVPDDYYFEMAKRIKRLSPHAEIHVMSGQFGLADAEYKRRGMIVHHSMEDNATIEDWIWMASADVLVMGGSTFSYIPAYLNPGCVVYTEYCGLPPLAGWIHGNKPDDAKLRACLV